jgi:hypothetical protein
MRVRVLHSYYGCETGCCGHIVELDGKEYRGSFDFMHSDSIEDAKEYAKDYIASNHPSCVDSIDWDSFEFIEGSC